MCALCAWAEKAEIAHCNYIDSSTSNDAQCKQMKGSKKGFEGCGLCDVYVSHIHIHMHVEMYVGTFGCNPIRMLLAQ